MASAGGSETLASPPGCDMTPEVQPGSSSIKLNGQSLLYIAETKGPNDTTLVSMSFYRLLEELGNISNGWREAKYIGEGETTTLRLHHYMPLCAIHIYAIIMACSKGYTSTEDVIEYLKFVNIGITIADICKLIFEEKRLTEACIADDKRSPGSHLNEKGHCVHRQQLPRDLSSYPKLYDIYGTSCLQSTTLCSVVCNNNEDADEMAKILVGTGKGYIYRRLYSDANRYARNWYGDYEFGLKPFVGIFVYKISDTSDPSQPSLWELNIKIFAPSDHSVKAYYLASNLEWFVKTTLRGKFGDDIIEYIEIADKKRLKFT